MRANASRLAALRGADECVRPYVSWFRACGGTMFESFGGEGGDGALLRNSGEQFGDVAQERELRR